LQVVSGTKFVPGGFTVSSDNMFSQTGPLKAGFFVRRDFKEARERATLVADKHDSSLGTQILNLELRL